MKFNFHCNRMFIIFVDLSNNDQETGTKLRKTAAKFYFWFLDQIFVETLGFAFVCPFVRTRFF